MPTDPTQTPPDAGDAARDPVAGDHIDEAIEQRTPSLEELQAEIGQLRAKADENWDQLLRARAEMENLRRRQAAELEKAHKFALDGFVRELLGVQDSLELGVGAAREPGADIDKLREGSELTLKLLGDVMAKFGVEPVDPKGQPFNPELHQAMSMQPSAEAPPNTVMTVIQKGYTLNGRLVRPALVMVSSAA
jgi:molecular chaperone GrpE